MKPDERALTLATALHLAVSNADDAAIARLMAAGADANIRAGQEPAFVVALQLAMFDVADQMIAGGADVNFQTEAGISCPPLVPAIMRDICCGSTERVAYLLARGADLDIRFRWAQESECTLLRFCQRLREWKITTAPERDTLLRIEALLVREKSYRSIHGKLTAQRRPNRGPRL